MMRRNQRTRLGRRSPIGELEVEEEGHGVVGVDAAVDSGVDGGEVEVEGSRGDGFKALRFYGWAMGDNCFREAVWKILWIVIRDLHHKSCISKSCNCGTL